MIYLIMPFISSLFSTSFIWMNIALKIIDVYEEIIMIEYASFAISSNIGALLDK